MIPSHLHFRHSTCLTFNNYLNKSINIFDDWTEIFTEEICFRNQRQITHFSATLKSDSWGWFTSTPFSVLKMKRLVVCILNCTNETVSTIVIAVAKVVVLYPGILWTEWASSYIKVPLVASVTNPIQVLNTT